MVINSHALRMLQPIKNMECGKIEYKGVSYGLGEAGYDIRIKQSVSFGTTPVSITIPQVNLSPNNQTKFNPDLKIHIPGIYSQQVRVEDSSNSKEYPGNFCLASTIEEFDMPGNLVGIVHDKSTWARRGLSVFNTVIEPGWKGFLTLELVYNGGSHLYIPAGAGIAQVIFHQTALASKYDGKYQNQENKPVPAIMRS